MPPCGRTPFGNAWKSGRGAFYVPGSGSGDPALPGRIQCAGSQERGHLGRVLAVIRQQHKGTEMVVPWEPKCGTLWPHSRFLSAKMEWPLAAHTQIFPSFPTVGILNSLESS